MSRPLRIEFPGAIYHAMSRGNARQKIFRNEGDYQRLTDGLARTVDRYGWELFSYVLMPNHIHLFFRTPQPNLCRGMQYLLSGYANWFAKRHQRPGHLFQGRYKGELVEDDTYFWNISRYLHLNSTRGKRPLVAHPRDWPWSSYPGFANRRRAVDWVAYDLVYSAWQGEHGGKDPAAAYRRFVEAGIVEPPTSPFLDAAYGWLLGSRDFVKRIRKMVKRPRQSDQVPQVKRLVSLTVPAVLEATAAYYGTRVEAFQALRSREIARDIAAWLARHHTTATLRELAEPFGLCHPDSVSNLTRRAERALDESKQLRKDIDSIRESLRKTENRV